MKVLFLNHAWQRDDAKRLVELWRNECGLEGFDASKVDPPDGDYDLGLIHDPDMQQRYVIGHIGKWEWWATNAIVIFCSTIGSPIRPIRHRQSEGRKTLYICGVYPEISRVNHVAALGWKQIINWASDVLADSEKGRVESLVNHMPPTIRKLLAPVSIEYSTALALLCDTAISLHGDNAWQMLPGIREQRMREVRRDITSGSWWIKVFNNMERVALQRYLSYEYEAQGYSECPRVTELLRALWDAGRNTLSLQTIERAHAELRTMLGMT